MKFHGNSILLVSALLIVAALMAAGCTGTTEAPPSEEQTTLTVFTAASLTGAFTDIGKAYESQNPGLKIDLVFDGSQALRTQIEQGASPDVFVSANVKHMKALEVAGFMDNETVELFVENSVAVIVPVDNPANITTLTDLANPGVKLVIGTKDVPFGSYTRQVLDKMANSSAYGAEYREAVMGNVISEETAVSSVVPKLTLGEADAAFVYKSDIKQEYRDELTRIDIPAEYNVVAQYPLGILAESQQKDAAAAFVAFVRGTDGSGILTEYGFDPIPQGQ
ncbi:molybdate ABC transporter substrate-binding protein [Methanoculleus sp. FWC-SCC1]|uniref:Molybdate ABC transporter substrate-binding protein n=1 Tax=Methanoculleus frigidifontis TaxID=2584085 RepID=A0ABT8MBL0_9EURY|nr:molybdate ABC transporter substrate-binding protein [Methanoculleus sp. FWC-SCC1]MDN7025313.1 molybdate ABC transporter substrate-binding protein [Methanoculleus sp. FWC-SCC1]